MKHTVLTLFAIISCTLLIGQNAESQIPSIDSYIKIEAGFNRVKFRDFATSPLFYSGALKHIGLSALKYKNGRERELSASFAKGVVLNTSNNHTSQSEVSVYDVAYSQLYTVKNTERMNLKVGGVFDNALHIRNNPSLQNNSYGFEVFSTLLASAKASWNISNNETKRVKFLFIPFRFKPKKRDLSFRLDLALMNNTFRNAYAYAGNDQIVNDNSLFSGHELKVFNGYRFRTELNYTVYLKNNNGIRLAYLFDGYKTGGRLDKFEMVNHQIKIALLFKTK